ncbi:alk-exo [Hyphantria cunea granulovirus]|uniref:Alk-exo n=1 Tax=Hyphantria cunea granulovirus TaxID=307448 RepID=A0AAF1D2B0_9BBAC|nr:alk-exo [Hyphantria cunea granulovirus]QBQ01662.1 alk-exo [Hyphantria cunea granulovirus]
MEGLTPNQYKLSQKYLIEKYTTNLHAQHRNTKEEIFALEEATRGQAKNNLWRLLRLNRTTSTKSGTSLLYHGDNDAMRYGVLHENLVKKDTVLMDAVCEAIELRLRMQIKTRVLDCGLFLSALGLYSASPDGYFVMENDQLVIIEIKCPYTFRDTTIEHIRRGFNTTRARYRIPNTAFTVNRRGPLELRVEKLNEHYRQMQRQLYVTEAVMAVYLVKIGNDVEVHFVKPDQTLIAQSANAEHEEFQRIIRENNKLTHLLKETNRLLTFQNAAIHTSDAQILARTGIYYHRGRLICYFCKTYFELEDRIEGVLNYHNSCTLKNNIPTVRYSQYISLKSRLQCLLEESGETTEQCATMAQYGLCMVDNELKLFCCGADAFHMDDCAWWAINKNK